MGVHHHSRQIPDISLTLTASSECGVGSKGKWRSERSGEAKQLFMPESEADLERKEQGNVPKWVKMMACIHKGTG